jgi:hypothetical protein
VRVEFFRTLLDLECRTVGAFGTAAAGHGNAIVLDGA